MGEEQGVVDHDCFVEIVAGRQSGAFKVLLPRPVPGHEVGEPERRARRQCPCRRAAASSTVVTPECDRAVESQSTRARMRVRRLRSSISPSEPESSSGGVPPRWQRTPRRGRSGSSGPGRGQTADRARRGRFVAGEPFAGARGRRVAPRSSERFRRTHHELGRAQALPPRRARAARLRAHEEQRQSRPRFERRARPASRSPAAA